MKKTATVTHFETPEKSNETDISKSQEILHENGQNEQIPVDEFIADVEDCVIQHTITLEDANGADLSIIEGENYVSLISKKIITLFLLNFIKFLIIETIS